MQSAKNRHSVINHPNSERASGSSLPTQAKRTLCAAASTLLLMCAAAQAQLQQRCATIRCPANPKRQHGRKTEPALGPPCARSAGLESRPRAAESA